jgi:hypothetical protein
VEQSYYVSDGLYVVGSLERGVTVYKQQIRAHNLIWAIWELHGARKKFPKLDSIAVVGGGIAGLTTAACALSLFDEATVTVFEQLWDLCPLQQGADNRWLHPRIYDWPVVGSRAPGASLPVLNWAEGRASDVARTIVDEFGSFSDEFDKSCKRLTVFLGLGHLRITASTRMIEWVANRATRTGPYFDIGKPEGSFGSFDVVVLTSGFGLETQSTEYPTPAYWRNEQLGQPILNGTRQSFLISGFGDGALTDLCRLTIERFRQDTIVYELFGDQLEIVESGILAGWPESRRDDNVFEFFRDRSDLFAGAVSSLSRRIRKDTRVVLHIGGSKGDTRPFSDVFGPESALLNRLLLFLLYRCGAFSISMGQLEQAVRQHCIPVGNVICRHGADTMKHLGLAFVDFASIETRLLELKKLKPQSGQRLWEPGAYPAVVR